MLEQHASSGHQSETHTGAPGNFFFFFSLLIFNFSLPTRVWKDDDGSDSRIRTREPLQSI